MDSVDKSEGSEDTVGAIKSETDVTRDVCIDKTAVVEDSHEEKPDEKEVSSSASAEDKLLCNQIENEEGTIAEKCVENESSEGMVCGLDKETTDTNTSSVDSSCADNITDPLSEPKTQADSVKEVKNYESELSKTVSNIIQEGKAYIIRESDNVFYNPVQEFNRDLSVLAISVFSEEHQNDPRCRVRGTKRKTSSNEGYNDATICSDEDTVRPREPGKKYDDGIVILEALSATGLRSIRYAKEVPGVKSIIANDISKAAVENIKNNIEYNSVSELVTTSQNDASLLMYMRKAQGNFFDVVDLDPYGCPSRFLDSAVQCVRDGGLLLITCTDMAVLAGNSPETCYIKYGAISLRNPACHEMALRIALQCIESHANRYGRYIVPQLSFSADFYIRVIVKVYTSPAMCKKTTSKLVMLYQCVGCQSLNYWPLGLMESSNKNNVKYHLCRGPPVAQECPHCDSAYYQGGPVWSGQLHNTTFVEKMLLRIEGKDFVTEKRMEGMLELIKEELVGTLLYHIVDSLCSKVHCEVIPRNKFVSAILNAGYKVSLSHAAPNSVKTNAPSGVIWDIIRCWVQEHPVNPKRLNQGSVAERLLSAVPRFQANFDLHPEVLPRNRKKLLRYQQNPLPFWGPGTRDKIHCDSQSKMSKSYVNQNKKHKRSNIDKERAEMKAVINSKNIDIIEVVTLTDDDDEDDIVNNIKQEKVEKNDSIDGLENSENRVGSSGQIEGVTEKSDDLKKCDLISDDDKVVNNNDVSSPLGKSHSDPSDTEKITLANEESVISTCDKVNEKISSNNDCPGDKDCEKGQVGEESTTV